jgi:hypothetical protein
MVLCCILYYPATPLLVKEWHGLALWSCGSAYSRLVTFVRQGDRNLTVSYYNMMLQPVSLLMLQGVMYSVGGSLLYAPCMAFSSEWWFERRGLANGVIFASNIRFVIIVVR